MVIIMLGAPGAGKGTQSKMLSEMCGAPHISTGDIFRENISSGTQLGKKAKEYIDSGRLVPDELTIGIVKDRISREDCSGGFILDGFPRTIAQAEALEKLLGEMNTGLDKVINIEVPEDELIRRITGRRLCSACGAGYHVAYGPPAREGICDECGGILVQRDDDREETVKERLKVYHRQTEPLVRFYESKGLLHTVDGRGSIEESFDRVRRLVKC